MNLKDLPERIKQLLARPQEARDELRRQFEETLVGLRAEAVEARKSSGIEDIWTACEENYAGVDDVNRTGDWIKPLTMQGSLRRPKAENSSQATAFIRMTSRYVDAATAKLGELTESIDEKPFSLGPTPVPDLIAGLDDKRPITDGGQPVMMPQEPAQPAPPAAMPGMPAPPAQPAQMTVKDLAQQQVEKAEDSAKKAETRIHDWMIECSHAGEMRKLRFDASRLGVGVLKGPVPDVIQSKAVTVVNGQTALVFEQKTVPVTKWISPWNFYPAPGCGENIHNGGYVFERDMISARQLRKLKDAEPYDAKAIDKVLMEGPGKAYVEDPKARTEKEKKALFEIWYFYGEIKTDDLSLLNPKQGSEVRQESVFSLVTMVNDTAIRATINPLDSGSFPYHTFSWSRRAGSWAGVGVGEQLFTPQGIVNAATRTMLNNAGKSAGSQIVIDREQIEPAVAHDWSISPDKLWFKKAGSMGNDIRQAFNMFEIPNRTKEMMAVIEYAFKLAEESTNIPLISQGQSGDTTPDTFSGQELQDNNANQLLRGVGMAQADSITKPLVEQFYEWLLLDPDVPQEEKGDFKCSVVSSYALIERAMQNLFIQQMGAMAQNPMNPFKINPAKWFSVMAKSKRIDPRDVQYTEAEQEQMAKNPPPKAPAVQAAEVRAVSAEKIAQGKDQVTIEKSQQDTDRDTKYQEALNQRAAIMEQSKERQLAMQRELEVYKENNGLKKAMDELKVKLATVTMELQTQKELSRESLAADMHKHLNPVITPPTEPAGRAPDGRAFQA